MLKTGYVIDERFADHHASANHPERPARIETLLDLMRGYQREGLLPLEPRGASDAELLLNHTREHLAELKATAGQASYAFDADTHAGARTYDTAVLAAGGLLSVVDAVMSGDIDNGFAMVRPPGHHAESDRAMGFCFFNNIAIAAHYLREQHGLSRIMILDWDVHHGNGTQRSFYANDDVLFLSLHQYPYYPGSGGLQEFGAATAQGKTVNVPFPAGFGDGEYLSAFRHIVEPVARQFEPEFVLISAGFDCHHLDPLGGMSVTRAGFGAMTRMLLAIASKYAGGRCAIVLEGGYSLDGLRDGVPAVLEELAGASLEVPIIASDSGATVIEAVHKVQRLFWDF